ncbi:S41 family peptidase [Mycoplasma feriruminatoris]|uniref:Peptidase n=1 Tax=Mycoplasma feriruminatoris TaxID=1179777 RepID=A0AAQ3DMJ5_9MOLU|nr:S41 family peptidase [Mycoplasma feriruminatoris]WFQ94868.1 peptidase [Mycoplasma feriruminatoris]
MKITAILSSLFLSPTLLNTSPILVNNSTNTQIKTQEFNLDDLTIKTSSSKKIQAFLHNDVFYTSINQFLKSIDSIINYSNLEHSFKDNKTTIKLKDDNNFFIEFNYLTKKITISNNKIFNKILKNNKRAEEDLKITFEKEQNKNNTTQFEIDLSKYNIDILKDQNDLYLPAILLNQVFLSESNIQTYFNGQDFKIFKFYEALSFPGTFYLKQSDKNNQTNIPIGLKKFQYEYLAFLFDNYYGIKLENNKSYKDYFKKYEKQILSESSHEHYLATKQIINELDDPHSAYVLDGYYDKSRDFHKIMFSDQKRIKNRVEVLNLLAKNDPNKIDYENRLISDDTSVISFKKFEENSAEMIKKSLDQAKSKNVKNIVFNLTQNGGGYIGGAFEILGFLTNQPFNVYSYNPLTKEKKVETIKSKYNKYDFNYYILTSPYSFSAGNIFPQIIKDNKLAKIIGYKTFGGASSINYYVLPTGDIIQLSSNNVFTNDNFESLEFGVTPDVQLDADVYKNPEVIYQPKTLLNLIKKANKIEKQPELVKKTSSTLKPSTNSTKPNKITHYLIDLNTINKKSSITRPLTVIQPANKINMLSLIKPDKNNLEINLLEKTNTNLSDIKNLDLDKLNKNDKDQILTALKNKNPDTQINWDDLVVDKITNNSAEISLKNSDQKIIVHFLLETKNSKNTIWIVLVIISITVLLGLINFIIIRKLKTNKLNK